MGLMDMFGGGESTVDNSGALADFAKSMRDRAGAYDPWVNTGNQSRDKLFGEYGKLTDNPNWLQDKVSSGFYESPYQKYMQDMVSKRMNYNSANTGMLGSGAANRALMEELTKMTGQFQNDYINRGMGSYGQGLAGYQGLADLGFKSMGAQDSLYEQAAGGQLQSDMSKNAYDASNETDWGSLIGGGLGMAAGAYFGGPQGAMMGKQMGSGMFGKGGGGAGGGGNLPNNWNFSSRGNSNEPVTDWSATGGRMPQFNTGSWSY